MDRRKLSLRREALAELTADELRAAAGADLPWSTNEVTCPANTCNSIRSLFRTMCVCPTD